MDSSKELYRKQLTDGTTQRGLSILMSDAVKNPRLKDAIILAHWEAQGYNNEQYADLWDFCKCLDNRVSQIRKTRTKELKELARDLSRSCKETQKAIDSLVFRSKYRGAEFQHSHGVSIFFPWADLKDAAGRSDLEHYERLAFAEDSQWNEFLSVYCKETIRDPLNEKNGKKGG